AGESADAVREAISQWVEDLEPLRRQLQVQNAVNAALDGFVEGLDSGNRALDQFIRSLQWESGRLRFDSQGFLDFAFNLIGNLLGGLFSGPPREVAAPREFSTPDPLRGGLRAAMEERERLIAKLPKLEAELRGWEAAVRARSQKLFPEWGSRRLSDAKREVDRVKREIENLKRAIEGFEVREFLGFTADDIARTVESGFDMADMSNLGQSLEGT